MKNKCYKNGKHCEKRRNCVLQAISGFPFSFSLPPPLFFFFFFFFKRSIVRKNIVRKGEITYNKQFLLSVLGIKLLNSGKSAFSMFFFPAFILYSLRKGYVLSMNGSDEGAEVYYGQLQLVMLYCCFKPLPHDFILTLSQTTNVRLFQTQRLSRRQF